MKCNAHLKERKIDLYEMQYTFNPYTGNGAPWSFTSYVELVGRFGAGGDVIVENSAQPAPGGSKKRKNFTMEQLEIDENFYNELINVELSVPCSSWDDEMY
jgi:hypothetical protein